MMDAPIEDLFALAKEVILPVVWTKKKARQKFQDAATPERLLEVAEYVRELERQRDDIRTALVASDLRISVAEKRTEAAEEKLVELGRQEPVGWMTDVEIDELHRGIADEAYIYRHLDTSSTNPLFTRPAPAVNLAIKYPARKTIDPYCYDQGQNQRATGFNEAIDEVRSLNPTSAGSGKHGK